MTRWNWEESDLERWNRFNEDQTLWIGQGLYLLLKNGEIPEDQKVVVERLYEEAMYSWKRRYVLDYGKGW